MKTVTATISEFPNYCPVCGSHLMGIIEKDPTKVIEIFHAEVVLNINHQCKDSVFIFKKFNTVENDLGVN